MTDQEAKSLARELIDKPGFSAFATVDEKGCPQIRAMMPVAVEDDFTVCYITHRLSTKCGQIAGNPSCSSLWTDVVDPMTDWRSALVKGKAVVTDEKALRDRFWMEELRDFFPGGADDPNFVVIVCNPTELIVASNEQMMPVVVKL